MIIILGDFQGEPGAAASGSVSLQTAPRGRSYVTSILHNKMYLRIKCEPLFSGKPHATEPSSCLRKFQKGLGKSKEVVLDGYTLETGPKRKLHGWL